MKFNKLLFTLPILVSATPVIAVTTNCSCSKYDVKLEGDCSKYLKVLNNSKYSKGNTYTLEVQIKDDYVNEYFLPEYVGNITCGDKTVYPLLEAEEDTFFVYEPNSTRTWAKFSVYNIQGPVKLDFEMTTIQSLSVEMNDSFETKAFFEPTQLFNTKNITVSATLSDDSEMEIEEAKYSVSCVWINHCFTEEDVGKEETVTITYKSGKKTFAQDYKAKCVKSSVVKMGDERYSTIEEAITAFNAITDAGKYYVRIKPGDYVFNQPLTINQNVTGKELFLMPDTTLEGNVSFSLKDETHVDSNLINIVNDGTIEFADVTFFGINFNNTGITSKDHPHNFVYANKANGIYFSNCKFTGSETIDCKWINVVKALDALNISFSRCISSQIKSYINGTMVHDEWYEDNNDLIIDNCWLLGQESIGAIEGKNLITTIDSTTAYIFYYGDQTVNNDAGFKLTGTGQIVVNDSTFEQRQAHQSSTGHASFFEVKTTETTEDIRNVVFTNCEFEEFIPGRSDFYTLYNNSDSVTWNYQFDSQVQQTLGAKKGI